MSVLTVPAQTRIGAESVLSLPASARYSSVVNMRPGHGEVVTNNPPVFTWFYATNHLIGYEQNWNGLPDVQSEWTNAFRLQISTQANFSGPLALDVSTLVNFYNFLAPLPTNTTRQFWWRVKYVRGGTPYWTNGPYMFTVANGAPNWDRSMLADAGYLATNGTHPVLVFRAGQQSAIFAWMQTQPEFAALTNLASSATNAIYWTNVVEWPTNSGSLNPAYALIAPSDYYIRVNGMGSVLNLWALSGDNRWTNAAMTGWLVTNLAHYANWFNHPSNNWAFCDYAQPAGTPEMPRLLAAGYDWMFNYLGADTGTFNGQLRTNLLLAMRRTLNYYNHGGGGLWADWPRSTGSGVIRYDHAYPQTTESTPWYSLAKIGTSHGIADTHIVMPIAIVTGQDSPEGALALNWMLNYMLARSSAFAGFAAHHVGPYGYVDNHTYSRSMFDSFMHLQQSFPQAQFERTDFCRRFPDWWTRMNPYRMRRYHGPYGDTGPSAQYGHAGHLGNRQRGWDLAAISRSGLAMQAFNLNAESFTVDGGVADWDRLPLRYHFRTTPAPQTNTTSAYYPEDGYVIASQISPAEFGCYTNGVGFSMRASPRSPSQGHNIYGDLAPDLWAYGAQITDGGGISLDAYGGTAAASPGLFVNGYGEGDYTFGEYGYSPVTPLHAHLANFASSGTNFVYACADGTAMFTNSYHPLKNLVTKVKRHVLFVRSKYWVIYDEFATTAPATFAFRWHVPWAFRFAAPGTAMAGETAFTGNRIGSNSLVLNYTGFSYTAGNYADYALPNPPRVPVHVHFANAPATLGIFSAVGTNSLGTGRTSVLGTANTNSTLNPFINRTYATANPDRAVGLWVTNRVASTNWHFMTVIVPQQPGQAAPSITTLDNSTVVVTYDGVTETNTFGTNYAGASTYRVEQTGAGSGRVASFGPPSNVGGLQEGFVPRRNLP